MNLFGGETLRKPVDGVLVVSGSWVTFYGM